MSPGEATAPGRCFCMLRVRAQDTCLLPINTPASTPKKPHGKQGGEGATSLEREAEYCGSRLHYPPSPCLVSPALLNHPRRTRRDTG
jgi:hypothetical protein